MLCTTEVDLFSNTAIELLFQVTQPHLERRQITAVELMFDPRQHTAILDDGERYQEALQRIAVLQGKLSTRSVTARLKELQALVDRGMNLVDKYFRQLGPVQIASRDTLEKLMAADSRFGRIWAGVALTRTLEGMKDPLLRLDYMLDLLKGSAVNETGALFDLTLAQLLRLRTVRDTLIPSDTGKSGLIRIYMAGLGCAPEQSCPALFLRLGREITSTSAPRLSATLRDLVLEIIAGPGLLTDSPGADLTLLRHLRKDIAERSLLATHEAMVEAFSRRFKRLFEPQFLNEILAQEDCTGRKLLLLLSLSAEVDSETLRTDLTRMIEHYVENTDIRATFVPPKVNPAALLTEVLAALVASPLNDFRKSKIRDTLAALFGGGVAPAANATPQRGVGGGSDAVLLNEEKLPLKNWSPMGLVFGPSKAPPAIGEKVTLTILIRKVELSLGFEAEAEVVQIDNGAIAARYRCVDRQIEQRIKSYFSKK